MDMTKVVEYLGTVLDVLVVVFVLYLLVLGGDEGFPNGLLLLFVVGLPVGISYLVSGDQRRIGWVGRFLFVLWIILVVMNPGNS